MGAHQEHCHLSPSRGRVYFLPPLASGLDLRVIPEADSVIAGQGRHRGRESLQPLGILMAIANENLGTLWGKHGVPHDSGKQQQLTW